MAPASPWRRPQDRPREAGLPVYTIASTIGPGELNGVLAWFRAQGAGYQTRMNAVLRSFRDAHKS
ncbi:MAG TPA: BrnA antitoxin family protein [Thermoanaerobaculia bacterium]|nr:BrnA antitoxin family protein [Thermoanaerobaculia bacterium]